MPLATDKNMPLTITPAPDTDYTIISNLARFYIYDMAEYTGWNFPADGLFDPENHFANYWGRPGKRPWPQAWHGLPSAWTATRPASRS